MRHKYASRCGANTEWLMACHISHSRTLKGGEVGVQHRTRSGKVQLSTAQRSECDACNRLVCMQNYTWRPSAIRDGGSTFPEGGTFSIAK